MSGSGHPESSGSSGGEVITHSQALETVCQTRKQPGIRQLAETKESGTLLLHILIIPYISSLINHTNTMNYFALIVAALVPMIMGMIFYHPKVMGNAWMEANGFTMEHVKANMPKPTMYILTLVTSFLLAAFFWAWVTGAGEADGPQTTGPEGQNYVTFQHGLAHGLIFGITVLLPIFTSMAIFEMRSRKWAIVNILYWTLTAMVMCGIISMWR